jgi:ATP-dependent 26S proteasome regulatory subunit
MDANVSRTNHDMAQAKLMRSMRPRSRDESGSDGLRNPGATHAASCGVNEDDLRLGLEGLERAARHQKSGKLASSLRLYELSIELLLKYLKRLTPGDIVDNPATTTDESKMVEQIVQTALSDAEALKASISTAGAKKPFIQTENLRQSRTNTNSNSPESIQSSSSFRSLSNALVSALGANNSRPTVPNRHSSKGTQARRPVNDVSARPTGTTAPDELYDTVRTEFLVDSSLVQKTKWSDIAGLQACQQALQEAAVLPLLRPDLCTGLRRPQHILLYGPPGTGKTMLVRAVAHESQSNLFVCTAVSYVLSLGCVHVARVILTYLILLHQSALTSKWMGEAEKLVRKLFLVARDMVPSILFLDEIDALLGSRKSDNEHEASRRLKTEFMVQVDGVTKPDDDVSAGNLLLLACTNCPWDVDSAVMRRFPRRIFVPLPDDEARRALIVKLLQKAGKHSITARQISALVRKTQGFTCADITAIASEASFGPLRALGDMQAIQNCRAGDLRPVQMNDFESALANGATKSVTAEQLKRYDDWQQQQQATAH